MPKSKRNVRRSRKHFFENNFSQGLKHYHRGSSNYRISKRGNSTFNALGQNWNFKPNITKPFLQINRLFTKRVHAFGKIKAVRLPNEIFDRFLDICVV